MTIVEFLLARITEDEGAAQECSAPYIEGNWRTYENDVGTIAMTKDRALAECAAKRAIVERYTTITETTRQAAANYQAWLDNTPDPYPGVSSRAHAQDVAAELETVVQHLATIYADHPDYREEWKS